MALEKIIIVIRKTRLEGLIERFNSRAQAKFYLDHSGGDYGDYERADSTYRRAVLRSTHARSAAFLSPCPSSRTRSTSTDLNHADLPESHARRPPRRWA